MFTIITVCYLHLTHCRRDGREFCPDFMVAVLCGMHKYRLFLSSRVSFLEIYYESVWYVRLRLSSGWM